MEIVKNFEARVDHHLRFGGWHVLSALILFMPLIQGGSPRLPVLVMEIAILALALWWAVEWGWKAPRQELRLSIFDILISLFLFWALFSLLFAPYTHNAVKALLLLTCYFLLYWFLVFHPSLAGLHAALAALLIQGLLQGALVWWAWHQGLEIGGARPAGTFYNPNFQAGFLAAAALYSLGKAVFPRRSEGAIRWPLMAFHVSTAGFMIGAVLINGSRGGGLALLTGLFVLLWARAGVLALPLTGAAASALIFLPNAWIGRISLLAETDIYAYSRISIWRGALEMIRDHPWFGVGLGQYEYFAPRYAFPVAANWAPYSRTAANPHSEYLHAGAAMGIMGLVLSLAVVSLAAWYTWRNLRKKPLSQRGENAPLIASASAIFAHAAVDFNLTSPPIALALLLLGAGARLQSNEETWWVVDFRCRKAYALFALLLSLFLGFTAIRPVLGFWYFLDGIGAPGNLLREKWSLEEAPRRDVPLPASIETLQKAVAADPSNAAFHHTLGSRYFRAYLKGEGGEDYRRKGLFHAHFAAQLNPNNYRYRVAIAQAMISLDRQGQSDGQYLEEALDAYRQALLLAPRLYFLHEEYGLLLDRAGLFDKAEESLKKAVELEPFYLRGWFNLGTFLARRGRAEEAGSAFKRGSNLAVKAGEKPVSNPYERALVDFDAILFENSLKNIESLESALTKP